ncbi:hypothetical protein [Vibrio alginolyticus]|uniref:hypothetical protein n=1 Tax=Vibrio alginolyticus TaxID=663 RepID=UPI003B678785
MVANSLDDGEVYSSDTAEKVFANLGIDINASGKTVDEILRDTESVVANLQSEGGNSELATKLVATANIVSDIIKANPTAAPEAVAVAAKSMAEEVIAKYPHYPKAGAGDVIYVTIPAEDTQKVVADVKEAIDNDIRPLKIKLNIPPVPDAKPGKPVDPVAPPAGGSGGN